MQRTLRHMATPTSGKTNDTSRCLTCKRESDRRQYLKKKELHHAQNR